METGVFWCVWVAGVVGCGLFVWCFVMFGCECWCVCGWVVTEVCVVGICICGHFVVVSGCLSWCCMVGVAGVGWPCMVFCCGLVLVGLGSVMVGGFG